MSFAKNHRGRLLRWLFALLALAVPATVGQHILLQWHHPVPEFLLFWHEPSVVYQVLPGGGAEAAGVQPGDVILAVNDAPFIVNGFPSPPTDLQVDQTVILTIERDGRLLELGVPFVAAARIAHLPFILPVIFALAFWVASTLLLWRRFWQVEVRLLFLLAQTVAIAALFPSPYFAPWYPTSILQVYLSGVCFFLAISLLLHYHVTFPVVLGTPRQRRWGLSILYGLKLVIVAGWVMAQAGWLPYWVWQLGGLYVVLEITAAIIVLIYVYLRRATPDGRRRLRLIVFGNVLAAGLPTLLYIVPAVAVGFALMPDWLVLLCLLVAPLSYFYATVRHNLFGIDRLLNRAAVYALLSLGILLLYLGPLLLIYRFLPGDLPAQALVVAGLTLLVGLTFEWTRRQVQRWVDRLFYGGWYDYPGVVETVSDALARTLEREQLAEVLTRQIPALMQLHPGSLHVSASDQPPSLPISQSTNLPVYQSTHLRYPLSFQNQPRGLWTVGPRRDGDDFTPADQRILATLAREAEIALGNVLLVETLRGQLGELRASRESLAQAQRQLLRSREEERGRLARELHDGPIQALVGLNMQLGLLLGRASPPPAASGGTLPLSRTSGEGEGWGGGEVADALIAMRGEVRGLLADLRQVCAELRQPMLDTLGLGAALRGLAEEWSAEYGVATRLDLPPDASLRPLPGEVTVNLYRIVQEALANVARHAGASLVAIRLAWEGPCLLLTVQDDGCGFSVPAALADLTVQGHFGLAGMAERAGLIGGALGVASAPGQGTTVRVEYESANQRVSESANQR
jgi:signal transduction histidine kinase